MALSIRTTFSPQIAHKESVSNKPNTLTVYWSYLYHFVVIKQKCLLKWWYMEVDPSSAFYSIIPLDISTHEA